MQQGSPTLMRTVVAAAAGLSLLALLSLPVSARRDPWPQYTNIAPLPGGGGVALNSEGRLDGHGAAQINIPVAYTPRWGYVQLAGYAGNYSNEKDEEFGNGSGVFALGFFGKPRVYMSGMQVSRHWDEAKVLSGQISVVDETEGVPAVAVGIQDMLEKEEDSRSLYLVATKQFSLGGRTMFGSAGFGNGRFLSRPFVGASAPLGDQINVVVEWDAFQLNVGALWRPGGSHGSVTLLGGYNGQAGWLAGLALAADFGK